MHMSSYGPIGRVQGNGVGTIRWWRLLFLLAVLVPSVNSLQWDRPLPAPTGLSQHTSVPIKLSTIRVFSVMNGRYEYQGTPDANFTLHGSVMVSFGGLRGKNDISSDVWMMLWPTYLNRGGALQWSRPPQYDARPEPRYGHAALSLDGFDPMSGMMFIFGGMGANAAFNSMWVYQLEANQWAPIGPACPPSFVQDGITYDTDTCYGDTVHQIDAAGCSWPRPRMGHTLTLVGDTVYLFGGRLSKTATSDDALGELWRLKINGTAWTHLFLLQAQSSSNVWLYPDEDWEFMPQCSIIWEQLTVSDGSARLINSSPNDPYPGNRFYHSATAWNGIIYYSGGAISLDPATGQYSEIWTYDPSNNIWAELVINVPPVYQPVGSLPYNRCWAFSQGLDQSLLPTYTGGVLFIAGGSSLGGSHDTLTWTLVPPNVTYDNPLWPVNDTAWTLDVLPFNRHSSNNYQVPSFGGAAVWLPEFQQLVIQGGQAGSSFVNAILAYDFTVMNTVSAYAHAPLSTQGTPCTISISPSPRYRHGQVLWQDQIVIFAGENEAGPITGSDMIYFYDVFTFVWSTQSVFQIAKPARRSAPIYDIIGQNLITYGGKLYQNNPTGKFNSELYSFDLTQTDAFSAIWLNYTLTQQSATLWDPTNTYTPESIGGEVHADGYLYPLPRAYAASVQANGKLIVFGGRVGSESGLASNDMWQFDLDTVTWTLLYPANYSIPSTPLINKRQIAQGNQPPGRVHHFIDINDRDTTQLILGFGLDQYGVYYGDIWSFSLTTLTFSQITPGFSVNDPWPSPRSGVMHSIFEGRLLIMGGVATNAFSDVYELDLSKNSWLRLDAPNDLRISGAGPTLKSFAKATIIPQIRTVFTFGGLGTRSALQDTHFLSVDLVNVGGNSVGPITSQFASDVLTLFAFSNQVTPNQTVPTFDWLTLGSAVVYYQYSDPTTATIPSGFVRYILQSETISTNVLTGLPITQPLLISNPTGDARNLVNIECLVTCFLIQTTSATSSSQKIEFVGLNLENGGFSEFIGPWAPHEVNGGAAQISGSNTYVYFQDCVFQNNFALGENSYGGALMIDNAHVTLLRCTFKNNAADALGGAIHALGSSLLITNSLFESNTAGNGSISDPLQLYGTDPTTVWGQGGALALVACLTVITNTTFINNQAGYGGAIFAINLLKQTVSISQFTQLPYITFRVGSGSTFMNNTAQTHGGAIYLSEMNTVSPVSYVDHSTFNSNMALNGSGGAIYLSNSYIRSAYSTFIRNSASLVARANENGAMVGAGGGGAIYFAPNVDTGEVDPPDIISLTDIDNAASFGSFMASVPYQIQILDGRAFDKPQVSGQIIEPPIVVALLDYYGNIVNTDTDTWVTILTYKSSLAGATTTRVTNGIGNFSGLSLHLAPTQQDAAVFYATVTLPGQNDSYTTGVFTSQICLPGNCIDKVNPSQCRECYAGGYQDQPGQYTCWQCAPGSYNTGYAETTCYLCSVGRYTSTKGTGGADCPACPAGFFTHGPGATECFQCEVGLKCQDGTATARAGYWQIPDAISNTTNTNNQSLQAHSTTTMTHSRFQATGHLHMAGMFALTASSQSVTVPCPNTNCLDGGLCNSGRVNPASINPLCGQCLDGYSPINGQCIECESSRPGLVFLVVLVAIFFTAFLHRLSRTSAGTSQIFFYFLQIVIFMSGSIGVWLDWISIFQLRPSAVSGYNCIIPMDEYQSSIFELCTPLMLTGILFCFLFINYLLSTDKSREVLGKYETMRRINAWWGEDPLKVAAAQEQSDAAAANGQSFRQDSLMQAGTIVSDSDSISVAVASSSAAAIHKASTAAPASWFYCQPHAYVRTVISIFLFSYQNISTIILTHLVCIQAGDHIVVFADPAMDCASSEYHRFLGFLIFMLILTVGFPIYLALRLYFRREQIWQWKAAANEAHATIRKIRAAYKGKERQPSLATIDPVIPAIPVPNSTFALRLGHLYEAYRSDTYYWQSVVLARRAVFVVFDVSLTYYPSYKLASYIIWNACMLLLHVQMQPYEDPYNNRMETTTLFILVLISSVLQMNQASNAGDNSQRNIYPVSVQVVVTLLIVFPCALLAWRMTWSALKPTYKILKARVITARKRRSTRSRGHSRANSQGGASEVDPTGEDGDDPTKNASYRENPALSIVLNDGISPSPAPTNEIVLSPPSIGHGSMIHRHNGHSMTNRLSASSLDGDAERRARMSAVGKARVNGHASIDSSSGSVIPAFLQPPRSPTPDPVDQGIELQERPASASSINGTTESNASPPVPPPPPPSDEPFGIESEAL